MTLLRCASRRASVILILSLLSAAPAVADTPAPLPSGPIHVKVGLFITRIYGFDLPNSSCKIQFWPWFLTTDLNYKPLDTVDVVNANDIDVRYPSTTVRDRAPWAGGRTTVFWHGALYTATLWQDWHVANFPFDQQTLVLQMEDGEHDASELVFEPDPSGSGVDPSVVVPGWKIISFTLTGGAHLYHTSFGDPAPTGASTYSRIIARITIRRRGLRRFFGLFNGFFVAFLLATLTYWMDVDEMTQARIGLCAGAIFAIVGTKYAVDSSLPPSTRFTLADSIEASTYATIVFALIVIVLLRRLAKRKPRLVGPANLACGIASAIGYVSFNAAMIHAAMH
jgi:hypothetical protein